MAEWVPVGRRTAVEKVKWWLSLLLIWALIVFALWVLWAVYVYVDVYRNGL